MPDRRTFRTRSIQLGALLLLAGCAHTPPIPKYAPATTGPNAQLLMRGKLLPGETYGVYLYRDAQACTGPQQVGVGTLDRQPAGTTVTANTLSTAEVFVTKPNKTYCRVRWSFEPVSGRRYVVSASSTATGCSALILDATDPKKIVPEPSSRRRDVGGKLCIPMAQTTTLADATSRARANDESDLPISTTPAVPAPPRPGKAPAVSEDDLGGLIGK